jgi:hypothetical protein
MEQIRLSVMSLAFAIGFAYLWSWPLRTVFKMGQGPLLQVRRGEVEGSNLEAVLKAAFRIGVFYPVVVGLSTMAGAGLVRLFDVDATVTKAALLVALCSVATARWLAMSYSGFMMRSLYGLALGVLAAIGYLWTTDVGYVHGIFARSREVNPELIRFYGIGVITAAIVGEGCWLLGSRLSPQFRQVTYSLMREYQEGHEAHEMAAYRGPMEKLFINTIAKCLGEWELREFYWKTWSGEPNIAQALLECICKRLSSDKPYGDMTEAEQGQQQKRARAYIQDLARDGKARVIMPLHPEFPEAPEKVEEILGIKPLLIPEVGVRRYLVINRRYAVISLPIPAEYSSDRDGKISETGSNFAITTQAPSRVHEYLMDFESLWLTYGAQHDAVSSKF